MKIRIALAVDSDGGWKVSGWDKGSHRSLMANALGGVDLYKKGIVVAQYWVEVEVEIPAPKVIQATAEKA